MMDPFARLDDGAYGADIMMEQAAFGEGHTNADLQLTRCYRDSGLLWEVETDAFCRRIRSRDGGTLAVVPSDVDSSDELVSPLYVGEIPFEFVRLPAADGENVITKVMTLDVTLDKLQLLSRLATVFEHMDGPGEIEALLDQLLAVGGSTQVEQLIERRLF